MNEQRTVQILLLEDDLALALHYREALEEAAMAVTHEITAEAAIETLNLAARGGEPIDLVITDILIRASDQTLMKTGGLTLISHIALNVRPKPKTIAISGADQSLGVFRHARILQVDETLDKPVDVRELVDIAQQLLSQDLSSPLPRMSATRPTR